MEKLYETAYDFRAKKSVRISALIVQLLVEARRQLQIGKSQLKDKWNIKLMEYVLQEYEKLGNGFGNQVAKG